MPSTYNDIGVNTRKTNPSSLFGTRKLKFLQLNFDYNVLTDDTEGGSYKNSGSLYWAVVTTIEEVAELYYLGAPTNLNNNAFVFAIADETAEWYYSEQGAHDNPELDPYEEAGSLYKFNDLYDRLADVFGTGWWNLVELEDTGWGLLPGAPI